MSYQHPIVSICWKYKELKQGDEGFAMYEERWMVTVTEELDEKS